MRRYLVAGISCLVLVLGFSVPASAGKLNAADYPLRVHVFGLNAGHAHYYYGYMNRADGDGRANLFENGQPTGFDFNYECAQRLHANPGYETYMARWKKPGAELELLLPVYGKPDAMDVCSLKVVMKMGTAYFKHNGAVGEEPTEVFRNWMVKHQYDPEHGLDMPVQPGQGTAPPAEQ